MSTDLIPEVEVPEVNLPESPMETPEIPEVQEGDASQAIPEVELEQTGPSEVEIYQDIMAKWSEDNSYQMTDEENDIFGSIQEQISTSKSKIQELNGSRRNKKHHLKIRKGIRIRKTLMKKVKNLIQARKPLNSNFQIVSLINFKKLCLWLALRILLNSMVK
jgi:hypothetical protein